MRRNPHRHPNKVCNAEQVKRISWANFVNHSQQRSDAFCASPSKKRLFLLDVYIEVRPKDLPEVYKRCSIIPSTKASLKSKHFAQPADDGVRELDAFVELTSTQSSSERVIAFTKMKKMTTFVCLHQMRVEEQTNPDQGNEEKGWPKK